MHLHEAEDDGDDGAGDRRAGEGRDGRPQDEGAGRDPVAGPPPCGQDERDPGRQAHPQGDGVTEGALDTGEAAPGQGRGPLLVKVVVDGDVAEGVDGGDGLEERQHRHRDPHDRQDLGHAPQPEPLHEQPSGEVGGQGTEDDVGQDVVERRARGDGQAHQAPGGGDHEVATGQPPRETGQEGDDHQEAGQGGRRHVGLEGDHHPHRHEADGAHDQGGPDDGAAVDAVGHEDEGRQGGGHHGEDDEQGPGEGHRSPLVLSWPWRCHGVRSVVDSAADSAADRRMGCCVGDAWTAEEPPQGRCEKYPGRC